MMEYEVLSKVEMENIAASLSCLSSMRSLRAEFLTIEQENIAASISHLQVLMNEHRRILTSLNSGFYGSEGRETIHSVFFFRRPKGQIHKLPTQSLVS